MKLVAIRYLGGILELPTFWSEENYQYQRFAATRLFSRTVEFIEDLDMESEFHEVDTDIDTADIEGLDILSTSILVGTETWISRLGTSVANECWFGAFVQFLEQFNRCGYESRSNFISLCLFSLVSSCICFSTAQRQRLSFRTPGFFSKILTGIFLEQK